MTTYTTEAIACGLSDVATERGDAEGFVLVPKQATKAMLDAAYAAHDAYEASEGTAGWGGLGSVYKAMIAALASHPGEADRVGLGELAARFEAKREECEKRLDEADDLYAKMLWRGRAEAFAKARDMARAGAASAVPASLAALGTGEGSGGAWTNVSLETTVRDVASRTVQAGTDYTAELQGSAADAIVPADPKSEAPFYQFREIGEGQDWQFCSKVVYDSFARDPHMDTREVPASEVKPHPQAPNTLSEVEEARALLEKEKRAYNGNPSEIVKYLRWRADLVGDEPETRLDLLSRADRIEAALDTLRASQEQDCEVRDV